MYITDRDFVINPDGLMMCNPRAVNGTDGIVGVGGDQRGWAPC